LNTDVAKKYTAGIWVVLKCFFHLVKYKLKLQKIELAQ
jgi:hypothetical protein